MPAAEPLARPFPEAQHPRLDLIDFFSGDSRGAGTIDPLIGTSAPLGVDSRGLRTGADSLLLTQRLREGDKPARKRRWAMRCTKDRRHCGGTLTDAAGPVAVSVKGNRAHIRYTMTNGLSVEQWLRLRADRRTIDNRLIVRKWGLRLAEVQETIRRAR